MLMGLMYNGEDRHPYSRDFAAPEIPCKVYECPANECGACVMPSCIEIGSDGKCIMKKKLDKAAKAKPKKAKKEGQK